MSAFYAMVKKELRSVRREKTIMIAVVIQLLIASFSSAIVTGLMAYYDPDSIGYNARVGIKVGVVGDGGSPLVGYLYDRNVEVATLPSPLDAEKAFQRGALDAVAFIPQDSGGLVDMKLFLPESEARSTMILMILKEPLKRYEDTLRKNRGVQVKYSDLRGMPSTTYEFRYAFIIPLLLMLFPAFLAGSMVIDSVSQELETHTLDTLWSAPLSLNEILGAKIVGALLLSVVQCALWSVLLRLNGIHIDNVGLSLLLAAVITALVAVVSAFVSAYFRDRERSQFVYSLFIAISTGMSYFFGASPMTLMTRLATGDHHTGLRDVAVYAVLLLALLTAFFSVAERLIRMES